MQTGYWVFETEIVAQGPVAECLHGLHLLFFTHTFRALASQATVRIGSKWHPHTSATSAIQPLLKVVCKKSDDMSNDIKRKGRRPEKRGQSTF